ncbi:MAG: methyltransferase domain-containing protein [Fuerstiella sp.]|nr:methyltransferase domain-containing protein [Fuerstiella sp.]
MNGQLSIGAAVKEARKVGLSKPAYEAKAMDFVKRAQTGERSIRPGVNSRFVDPRMDVTERHGRFEIESRKIYTDHERVLDICDIRPGITVADLGAGTGFYSRLFASAVGTEVGVYAVDISPRFLNHTNQRAIAKEVPNITSVLCSERGVSLPPNSVDIAFICDTCRHLEYPQSTLASVRRALQPGRTLMVIDIERIPGKTCFETSCRGRVQNI